MFSESLTNELEVKETPKYFTNSKLFSQNVKSKSKDSKFHEKSILSQTYGDDQMLFQDADETQIIYTKKRRNRYQNPNTTNNDEPNWNSQSPQTRRSTRKSILSQTYGNINDITSDPDDSKNSSTNTKRASRRKMPDNDDDSILDWNMVSPKGARPKRKSIVSHFYDTLEESTVGDDDSLVSRRRNRRQRNRVSDALQPQWEAKSPKSKDAASSRKSLVSQYYQNLEETMDDDDDSLVSRRRNRRQRSRVSDDLQPQWGAKSPRSKGAHSPRKSVSLASIEETPNEDEDSVAPRRQKRHRRSLDHSSAHDEPDWHARSEQARGSHRRTRSSSRSPRKSPRLSPSSKSDTKLSAKEGTSSRVPGSSLSSPAKSPLDRPTPKSLKNTSTEGLPRRQSLKEQITDIIQLLGPTPDSSPSHRQGRRSLNASRNSPVRADRGKENARTPKNNQGVPITRSSSVSAKKLPKFRSMSAVKEDKTVKKILTSKSVSPKSTRLSRGIALPTKPLVLSPMHFKRILRSSSRSPAAKPASPRLETRRSVAQTPDAKSPRSVKRSEMISVKSPAASAQRFKRNILNQLTRSPSEAQSSPTSSHSDQTVIMDLGLSPSKNEDGEAQKPRETRILPSPRSTGAVSRKISYQDAIANRSTKVASPIDPLNQSKSMRSFEALINSRTENPSNSLSVSPQNEAKKRSLIGNNIEADAENRNVAASPISSAAQNVKSGDRKQLSIKDFLNNIKAKSVSQRGGNEGQILSEHKNIDDIRSRIATEKNVRNEAKLLGRKKKGKINSNKTETDKKSMRNAPERINAHTLKHFCQVKISKKALNEFHELMNVYFDDFRENVRARMNSKSTNNHVIEKEDVYMIMKQLDIASSWEEVYDLGRELLPSDLYEQFVPINYGFNKVYPKD